MKVLYLSDLHLEFCKDPQQFLEDLFRDIKDVDVCIIAGDFFKLSDPNYKDLLGFLSNRFPTTIMVYGNHEFYGSDITDTSKDFDGIFNNVHILHNKSFIEINGILFIGNILFTDICMYPFMDIQHCKNVITDFRSILYGQRKLDVMDIYDYHLQCLEKIKNGLKQKADVKICITHHIPDISLISHRYKDSNLNPAFACKKVLESLEEWPNYWIFGHTHDSIFREISQCKFLCNPYGYPGYQVNPEFSLKTFEV